MVVTKVKLRLRKFGDLWSATSLALTAVCWAATAAATAATLSLRCRRLSAAAATSFLLLPRLNIFPTRHNIDTFKIS